MKSVDINVVTKEDEIKKQMLEFLEGNSFIQHLGIEMLEMSVDGAYAKMPYREEVLNPYKSVHGGVLYSFADIVAGTTAAMEGKLATTVNGSMDFLEPAWQTEYVYCKASKVRSGKQLSVFNVEIRDDDGKLLEQGSFTFFKTSMSVMR